MSSDAAGSTSTVRIALAKGDGIGPEIMDATLALFDAAGVMKHVEFVPVEMGARMFLQGNTRGMSDEAVRVVEDCGILFKGPMETPKGTGGKSINVTARKLWSAFANLRRFQSLPGVSTVYSKAGIPVDFFIVRENLEDTYGGIEHRVSNDVMQCKRLITAPGSDQVHRFAFQTARALGIDTVHCGHKANIMKMTDGLFLERFRRVAADFPEIKTGDVIIDALCMNLVLKPQQYKMVVLPNLQGDIVSDLAAGLIGGLGFAPSANIGNHISIFEAVHGTAPDIVGKGIANPTALILSGLMMLRHVGLYKQADAIENAILCALEEGVHTGDFGAGPASALGTAGYVKEVTSRLGRKPGTVPARTSGANAEQDRPTYQRKPRPTSQTVLQTFGNVVKHVYGADIYIDEAISTLELSEQLNRIAADTPFRLTLISNRGTQVWPTGSVFTECTDYYRVRFELKAGIEPGRFGQAPVIALLDKVAERFAVSCFELLRTFDGKPGYSLAQGQ
jgi:isocitrate dehydrogenase